MNLEMKGVHEMKAIIYRHNEALAQRVTNAGADFVHEFPATTSEEDIAAALPTILSKLPEICELFTDGTVRHAMGTIQNPYCAYIATLIRQDNINSYDLYAQLVAKAAKKSGGEVILVRECIAHHNTEDCDPEQAWDIRDEPSRIKAVLDRWVTRLQANGITPRIVDTFFNNRSQSIHPDIGNLSGKIVVVDKHHVVYDGIIIEAGATHFNAYPVFTDADI